MILLWHEIKMNIKSLVIWTLSVGLLCAGCILLFGGMKESMDQMADMYSEMGAFSAALGLDKLSINTMEGYYATEIALIFSIGGAMFAAMMGAVMLSKEEEGHTAEFLNTLPFGRKYILSWKYIAVLVLIVLFNAGCIILMLSGFAGAGEMPPLEDFILYHATQLLMHVEVGSICYLVSACSKRKQIGGALGFAIILYVIELMCRVVPDIENLKYITPFYYSNAADIFYNSAVEMEMVGIGFAITIVSCIMAFVIYNKRDLSA